jgi:hypothetical protein
MTALIIILCLVLFFFILLLCPVTVYAHFEDELTAKIRYLLVSYKIFPRPKEEKAKAEEEEKKEKTKTDETILKIKDIIKQKGLSGFLSMIKEFASIATGTGKKIFSHMIINNISTDIVVADEDAAQTAIIYGYVCGVVYTSMGLFVNNMKCREYHINIVPNFQSKEYKIRFEVKAHIRLLYFVSFGLSALIESLKILKAARLTSNIRRKQKIKE